MYETMHSISFHYDSWIHLTASNARRRSWSLLLRTHLDTGSYLWNTSGYKLRKTCAHRTTVYWDNRILRDSKGIRDPNQGGPTTRAFLSILGQDHRAPWRRVTPSLSYYCTITITASVATARTRVARSFTHGPRTVWYVPLKVSSK
jgi:hypothetical protein